MELKSQVVSLELAKRLISDTLSNTYAVLPEMQKGQELFRVLSEKESEKSIREIPSILQALYLRTTKRLVLQQWGKGDTSKKGEGKVTKEPQVLQREKAATSLGRQNEKSRGLWRSMHLLWGKGTKVFSNRPYRGERKQAQERSGKEQDYLRMASPKQLPKRVPGAMPQLQYGYGILGYMPS